MDTRVKIETKIYISMGIPILWNKDDLMISRLSVLYDNSHIDILWQLSYVYIYWDIVTYIRYIIK